MTQTLHALAPTATEVDRRVPAVPSAAAHVPELAQAWLSLGMPTSLNPQLELRQRSTGYSSRQTQTSKGSSHADVALM